MGGGSLSLDDESVVNLVAGSHRIIIEKLTSFVDEKDAFKNARKAVLEGGEHVLRIPQLFDLIENFRYDNELFFIRSLMTVYVASALVAKYEWQSPDFFKKIAIGSMLADVLLYEDDLVKLNEWDRGEVDTTLLPADLLEQSEKVVRLLNKYKLPSGKPFFSQEVITIVSQHNERGDGSGIPNQIKHSSITLLTSIYLVSRYFCFLLTEKSFNTSCKEDITLKIKIRFSTGHLKTVASNLIGMIR